MTPEQLQTRLEQAAKEIAKPSKLMRAIVFSVEGKAIRGAPVRTGALRASISSRVDTPARGYVSASVDYAIFVHEGTQHQKAQPFLRDAVEQSENDIRRLMSEYGEDVFRKVGR